MSSGTKKGHRRSTSNSGATAAPSNIPCAEPGCTATFTREAGLDRHMETIHGDVLYECLLNTCTSKCPKHCQNPQHSCAFPRSRKDKVRRHLQDVHQWKITMKELPKSWMRSYIRERAGWSCESCGAFLGNWIENSDTIDGHAIVCTDGLPTLIKRWSLEQPIEGGDRSRQDNVETINVSRADATADNEDEEEGRNSLF